MNFVTVVAEDANHQNQLDKIDVDFLTEFFLKFGRPCLIKQIDSNKLVFKFPELSQADKQFEEIYEFLQIQMAELDAFANKMSLTITVNESRSGMVAIEEQSLFSLCCTIKQIFLDYRFLFRKNMNARLVEVCAASATKGKASTSKFKILKSPIEDSSIENWNKQVTDRIANIEQAKLAKQVLPVKEIDSVSMSELKKSIVAFLNNRFPLFCKVIDCNFIENGEKLRIYGYQKQVEAFVDTVRQKKTLVPLAKVKEKLPTNQPAIKPVYEVFLIDQKSFPLEWSILSNFEGKYFRQLAALLNKQYGTRVELESKQAENRFHVKHVAQITINALLTFIQQQFTRNFATRCIKLVSKYQLQKYEQVIEKQIDRSLAHAELDKASNKLTLLGERLHVNRITELIAKHQFPPSENKKTVLIQKRPNDDGVPDKPSSKKLKKPEISAKISGLKWYQIRLILLTDLIETLRKTFTACQVALDAKFNELVFKSESAEELERAKTEAMRVLRHIVAAEIECANKPAVIQNYKQNMAVYIDLFSKAQVVCVLDIETVPGTMLIYAMNHDEIKKCQGILCNNKSAK